MQPVGLKLLIFPPLPRSQADVEEPSSWDIRGRWDGGTEARQVFLEPGVPLSRKTIQLLHSCEAPTGPEGEKGPFCVLAFSDPHRDRDGPDKLGGGRRVLGCLPR